MLTANDIRGLGTRSATGSVKSERRNLAMLELIRTVLGCIFLIGIDNFKSNYEGIIYTSRF